MGGSPFATSDAFQLSGPRHLIYDVLCNHTPYTAEVTFAASGPHVRVNGAAPADVCTTLCNGVAYVFKSGACFTVEFPNSAEGAGAGAAAEGALRAPMPGRIIAVHVKDGQEVEEGQPLIVLEAMKMEHVLRAPFAGKVSALAAEVGSTADMGAVLAIIA